MARDKAFLALRRTARGDEVSIGKQLVIVGMWPSRAKQLKPDGPFLRSCADRYYVTWPLGWTHA